MRKQINRFIIKLIKRLGISTIIGEVLSFVVLVIGISLIKDAQIIGCLFILIFLLQSFLFIRFFLKVFNHLRLEEEQLRKFNKEMHNIINNKN